MGERNMEGEDSVKTVDCLRGRLLAERAASRYAKEEAHLLQNKLLELETLLKQEAKSRKRAEKKLKFLMKKLESIGISSDESGSIDKSDISSITKEEESIHNHQIQISKGFQTQESKGGPRSRNLDSQNSSSGLGSDCTTTPEGSSSVSSAFDSPRKSKISGQRNPTFEDSLSENSSSNRDKQSELCYLSIRSSTDEEGHDSKSEVDSSMALVPFNTPQKSHRDALDHDHDHSVREVLDSLRRAKGELRSSMQRRRMNVMMRVGEVNLSVKTSYHFHSFGSFGI